jgi:hypothetical protein
MWSDMIHLGAVGIGLGATAGGVVAVVRSRGDVEAMGESSELKQRLTSMYVLATRSRETCIRACAETMAQVGQVRRGAGSAGRVAAAGEDGAAKVAIRSSQSEGA